MKKSSNHIFLIKYCSGDYFCDISARTIKKQPCFATLSGVNCLC